jgi:hypothetical protein
MKKTYILISIAFLSMNLSTGQNSDNDFLDIIASKTCECVEKSNKTETEEDIDPKMQVGMCLLESAKGFKKQLAEQYNFNLDNLAKDAQEFGEIVGNRMAFICPNTLLKFSTEMQNDKEEAMFFFASGEVTDINQDMFVVFNVKNQDGKIQKFYWLTFLTSEYDVQNSFVKLKGNKIKIKYTEEELFDPRIKEYRIFNSISSLELIE